MNKIFSTVGTELKAASKGWRSLQQRFYRPKIERVVHPSIVEALRTVEMGDLHTPEWRLFFEKDASKLAPSGSEKGKLSPWHDIPFGFQDPETDTLYFNYVHEIPKGDRAKMECSPKEEWNPFKQDIKKGNLRFFKYGDLPFNYGFVPQTWEDPNQSSRHSDVSDLKGDNDPLDVVEISGTGIPRGQIVPIKVISVLGLIDEGEADWKIIGIRADHPRAAQINSIKDANHALQTDLQNIIVDWFQKYKVPDGKPENRFTHNAQFQGPEMAIDVIEDAHRQWYDLILGAVKTENSLQSLTRKHLIEKGIVRDDRMPQRPDVTYPMYENWNSKNTSQTFGNKKYHGEEETCGRKVK